VKCPFVRLYRSEQGNPRPLLPYTAPACTTQSRRALSPYNINAPVRARFESRHEGALRRSGISLL
jgi:hypothetical protein